MISVNILTTGAITECYRQDVTMISSMDSMEHHIMSFTKELIDTKLIQTLITLVIAESAMTISPLDQGSNTNEILTNAIHISVLNTHHIPHHLHGTNLIGGSETKKYHTEPQTPPQSGRSSDLV